MGQVSLYQEALKFFFRGGLILNDQKILDPWVYSFYNTGFFIKMSHFPGSNIFISSKNKCMSHFDRQILL